VAGRNALNDARRASAKAAEPSGATIALNLSVGGFGILAVVGAVLVAKTPPWTLSSADAIFWGAVVALAVVRLVELRRSAGGSSPGQTDNAKAGAGWKKFALVLGAIAAVVWLAAQAVQGGRS
jgi:sensor domain CHASE-containing protein